MANRDRITHNNGNNASVSPSSSHGREYMYDVFLSFRGEDTRKNFVSHLYKALDQKGIYTFKDDETLPRGKQITPKILEAIEESRVSVIVFSENYAASEWCLDELAKCLECMDTGIFGHGHSVLPIFYEIDPSNLNDKAAGSYAKALAKHEEAYKDSDQEKVKRWKFVLKRAADLSGWDSRKSKDEAQLIEEIVEVISENLPHNVLSGDEHLVGIDCHLSEMVSLLYLDFHDVRFVGIWGMGGIGKTTIAKAVYDQISDQFEGSCFLENVKESFRRHHSLAPLQNELLSQILLGGCLHKIPLGRGCGEISNKLRRKKVLIVLDDVDHLEQLKCLAGKHEWFGLGSRVIITTRDKHLLIAHGVDDIYEVETLNFESALKLLSWHAFKQNHPTEEFMDLSYRVASYASGLPLAIKVLGSCLFSRTKPQWEDILRELKSTPNMETQDVLRVSYDGLQQNEKQIFLDIACFYRGMDKCHVTKILDSCGFCPIIGMKVLMEKSLISISNNKLWMHDLLQEMGMEIVRSECIEEPGKRSRLWTFEDIHHVLTQKTGTEKVEGFILDLSKSEELQFSTEALSNMSNLRLLIIYNTSLSTVLNYHSEQHLDFSFYTLVHMFKQPTSSKIHLSGNFKFLSQKLRCLCWHGYPLKSLPSNFYPKNLLELDMRYSHVEQLWDRKKCFDKLELIDLSHSKTLKETPNFQGVPNLKRLILESCTGLNAVHPSVGDLKMLVFLSLKDCKNLVSLPNSICGLKSLRYLILAGCTKLRHLPESLGLLKQVEMLDVSRTSLRKLPSSIALLENLRELYCGGCNRELPCFWQSLVWSLIARKNLFEFKGLSIPTAFSGFFNLERLDLSSCNLLAIPKDIGSLSSLTHLHLNDNNFVTIPSSIKLLSKLRYLDLNHCRELQSLPELPAGIHYVGAHYCTSLEAVLGTSPGQEWHCRHIELFNCFKMAGYQNIKNTIFTLLESQVESTLKKQPQGLYESYGDQISIIIPGNEIPSWFSHQTKGSSLTVKLPSFELSSTKLMGLALSIVCRLDDRRRKGTCYLFSIFAKFTEHTNDMGANFIFTGSVESDHLALYYKSFPQALLDNCSYMEVSVFHGGSIEVKRIGARLIYGGDDTNTSSSSYPNLEKWAPAALDDDFDGSIKEATAATLESNLDLQQPCETLISSSSSSSSNIFDVLARDVKEPVLDGTAATLEANTSSWETWESRILNYVWNFLLCTGLTCFFTRS